MNAPIPFAIVLWTSVVAAQAAPVPEPSVGGLPFEKARDACVSAARDRAIKTDGSLTLYEQRRSWTTDEHQIVVAFITDEAQIEQKCPYETWFVCDVFDGHATISSVMHRKRHWTCIKPYRGDR